MQAVITLVKLCMQNYGLDRERPYWCSNYVTERSMEPHIALWLRHTARA